MLAGVDHILKAEHLKKMAYYFGQLSGVIPYTISQANSEVYARQMKENTIYLMQGNIANCDLYVINNLAVSSQEQHIKDSLSLLYIEFPQKIIQYLAENQNLLLSVFLSEEFNKYEWQAVPVLNYLLAAEQQQISLFVPIGQYVCIIRTSDGKVILKEIVNVKI